MEAAVLAIRTAEALNMQGMLHEAYALTIDVLAVAATTLLAVELGAPENDTFHMVGSASRNAKKLLEGLAKENSAAAQCLESLMVSTVHHLTHEQVGQNLVVCLSFATDWRLQPLYQGVTEAASAATAPTERVMQDFTLLAAEDSEFQSFDSQLEPCGSNIVMANPPDDWTQTLIYSTMWSDLGYDNNGTLRPASNI